MGKASLKEDKNVVFYSFFSHFLNANREYCSLNPGGQKFADEPLPFEATSQVMPLDHVFSVHLFFLFVTGVHWAGSTWGPYPRSS